MKRRLHWTCHPSSFVSLLALGFAAIASSAPATAQISAVPQTINFQGRLATPSGNPVPNGTYSIRFSLWNVATGGTAAANEKWNQTIAAVQVRNGTFAVALAVNTGAADKFNGNLWLELKVGTDAALTPRTPLNTVPYAMKSDLALSVPDGSLTASKFASGVLNANAWLLGGNSGTNSASQFLGTTDNQPLELRVNSRRVMRYQYIQSTSNTDPNFHYRTMNVLGGSEINEIAAGVTGATIGGGGQDYFTGTDLPNRITAEFGTVGGGRGNTVSGNTATVGGGERNTAGDFYATVGGGIVNTASNEYTTVGGGVGNNSSGNSATIGGGSFNTAANFYDTVGGGRENFADGEYSTIGGGVDNIAGGLQSTVGGGYFNTASGYASTVPGGNDNIAAGVFSFAAGRQAQANHTGAFVWADSNSAAFASSGNNQFCIRASGGLVFEAYANPILFTASTEGEKNRYLLLINSPQTQTASGLKAGGILCADAFAFSNPGKNDLAVKGKAAVGFDVNSTSFRFAVNGDLYCIGFTNASDARWKKNVAPLDNALDAILNLRGVSYEWKPTEGMDFPDGKQIGFLAQEVENVLPELVRTDKNGYKSVAYTNVVPVIVEAVKTLKRENDAKLKQKDAEISELRAQLDTVLKRLDALEATRK